MKTETRRDEGLGIDGLIEHSTKIKTKFSVNEERET